jgi:hypothetical protein
VKWQENYGNRQEEGRRNLKGKETGSDRRDMGTERREEESYR